MIPELSWFLALLLISTVFFALFLGLGMHAHKAETKKAYSFLTLFPFEMMQGATFERRASRISFYFYALTDLFAGSYLLLTLNKHTYLLSLAIVYLVVVALRDAALAAMGTISAYEPRLHLFSFVCFAGLSVLSAIVATVLFVNMMPIDNGLALGFSCGVGTLAGIAFLVLINPRLAHWGELKATVDQDGNVNTFRPKPFVLAFSEWLLIFLSFVSSFLALLGFTLLSLN